MSGSLEGLKVLDLSRLLPGPYATLVLADLGAQVDKVEDPQGDGTRQLPPTASNADTSALFLALNRNKRSIVLDLKASDDLALFKALVPHYDVLVESFRPGVMDKLGCGYEVLRGLNPRLVYCAISGYGATGPDRGRAGHDINYLARSGVLGFGGPVQGPPSLPGAQVADLAGSLFGVIGILAALQARASSGLGQFVDVSMTDGAQAFIHLHLAARLLMGSEGSPLRRGEGALGGAAPCYGVYATSDGRFLAVGALEPKFFTTLCEALQCSELVVAGWDTVGEAGRQARAQLERVFASRTLAEWVVFFRGLDCCVEPVLEGDELWADAQAVARGRFVRSGEVMWVKTPLAGEVAMTPAPRLGADRDAILRECGLKV